MKRLKKRFRIGQVCIVSDRGMTSDEVMEWLESEKWPYILGVRMRQQKEVRENVLSRGGRYRLVTLKTESGSKISGRGKSREFERDGNSNSNGDKARESGIKSKPPLSPLRVKEVEIEKDGKRFVLRSEAQGCCGEVFKATGVGFPPSFRQVKFIENEKDKI